MVNKYKYTGKNRKYLNKKVIEYMKTLIEAPEATSDITECIKLMKIIHENVIITSDDFRKAFGEVLDCRLDEHINDWFMCERIMTTIKEKYLARAIQFIAVDIYTYANYEDYEETLSDLTISEIRQMLALDMCNWLERVFIKTQQLYLDEGVLEERSYKEMEAERRENAMDEKMFWDEYGGYIDLD
jgi:hypothetical protein